MRGPFFKGTLPQWMTLPLLHQPKAEIHFECKEILQALEDAEDGSLFFIDTTNVIMPLGWKGVKKLFALFAKKLHPLGVALIFAGAYRWGPCWDVGGDLEACKERTLELAKVNGLHVHPKWANSLEQLKGDSWTTYFWMPLKRVK